MGSKKGGSCWLHVSFGLTVVAHILSVRMVVKVSLCRSLVARALSNN